MAEQLDRAVDGRRRQDPIRLPIHDAWQLEVRDEVLDVGRLDVRQQAIAESIGQRLEPIVDRFCDREPFGLDVPLLVDLSELAERQCRHVARRLEAALVEHAVAHRAFELVERRASSGLAVDFTVRPLCETDTDAPEAAPPGVVASIAGASFVLADLVETHGFSSFLLLTILHQATRCAPRCARGSPRAHTAPATRRSTPASV